MSGLAAAADADAVGATLALALAVGLGLTFGLMLGAVVVVGSGVSGAVVSGALVGVTTDAGASDATAVGDGESEAAGPTGVAGAEFEQPSVQSAAARSMPLRPMFPRLTIRVICRARTAPVKVRMLIAGAPA
jgi:hypothetical protein